MTGVQFVVDENGERKAVILDLGVWGELWEDIDDYLVSQSRKDEEEVPWEQVKANLGIKVSARG